LVLGLLKGVSRSFYLSVAILPKSLRTPIGLAYLFARAADTISDTKIVRRAERLEYLELLRGLLSGAAPGGAARIRDAIAPHQTSRAEAELVGRLADCLAIQHGLPPHDRERIARLLRTITEGMRLDLTRFPGEDEERLVALETRAELDQYTYHVAGCVGEFWTETCIAHRPRFARWDAKAMAARGVRFGKGLQMTNVLRDLARDLRIGRCYLPREDLRRLGVAPVELLDPASLLKVRPLLADLLRLTMAHYEEGWTYTLAIPRPEAQIRLACAWPLLIGIQTLTRIARSPNLLDPDSPVKISRRAVYRLMARSGLTVCSNHALTRHYQSLRAQLSLRASGTWWR
jgi:farnesyl-diphosphate farnesyltransferase